MPKKQKIAVIVAAIILGLFSFLYLCGILSQFFANYAEWMANDGMSGKVQMHHVNPKVKTSTGKKVGNRTLIGIVCILVAFVVCFLLLPMMSRSSSEQVEIVRIKQVVTKGSMIGEGDIEVVNVGAYNLPSSVLKKKDDVVGKYARGDLYPGEYLLPSKLTSDIGTATDIMESLDGSQKAISLTIGSFAQGLSGKLETGDIISVIVYSQKDGFAYTPPELQYIKVITSTTSTGVDKANIKDTFMPIVSKLTDIRLVNSEIKGMLIAARTEYWMMAGMVVANIPMLYILNRDWYDALMNTVPGKLTLGVCGLTILITAILMFRFTKPAEYKG